ncbi:MAG: branched-chain amino acid ABC transporter permease [bacterium]
MELQQLLNFLTLGCVYTTVALGFTLYFGTVNLINFAHGELCMLAAFGALMATRLFDLHLGQIGWGWILVTTAAGMLLTIGVGWLSYWSIFRRIRGRPLIEGLLVSIALSMLLRELILHLYPNGGNPQPFPDPFHLEYLQIGDITISYMRLTALLICGGLTVLFYFLVLRTDVGRVMRAISQDPEAAVMMGLPVERIIGWSFVIGSALAGIAGIMTGALYGSVKFDMGIMLGVKGFVAAVVGGLDNPRGALMGGLMVAGLEVFVVGSFAGGSAYRDIVVFAVLIGLILIRPQGLLGRKVALGSS